MSANHERVQEILDEIAKLPPEEWPAYLNVACSGEEEVRSEVESLMAHVTSTGFDEGGDSEKPPRMKSNPSIDEAP